MTARAEAQRQQAFMALLAHAATAEPVDAQLALHETGVRAARGLEAYRANAQAIADRALTAAFATVREMVGPDAFERLAAMFARDHPPLRGDLGEWGDAFAGWLQTQTALAEWPWLADGARLDLALHRAERAADASFDAASLALLESADPRELRLVLMPGVALLRSRWPIVAIHRAHQLAGAPADAAFAAVRESLSEGRGEVALVARRGWRAVVQPLDAAAADWTASLLEGLNLDAALARAGEGFDFAAWLDSALRESWLKGVVAAGD